jgi:hypothetical protein
MAPWGRVGPQYGKLFLHTSAYIGIFKIFVSRTIINTIKGDLRESFLTYYKMKLKSWPPGVGGGHNRGSCYIGNMFLSDLCFKIDLKWCRYGILGTFFDYGFKFLNASGWSRNFERGGGQKWGLTPEIGKTSAILGLKSSFFINIWW